MIEFLEFLNSCSPLRAATYLVFIGIMTFIIFVGINTLVATIVDGITRGKKTKTKQQLND